MPSHEELLRWDREIVWHAFTQMAEYEPLLIERAEGCTLFDIDGREYLDGVEQPVVQPARPSASADRRRDSRATRRVAQSRLRWARRIRRRFELAKRLVDIAPAGLNHVFFSDDGATAVEVALKMAFQYWRQRPDPRPEKTLYVALGDAYHGDTLGGVSVGGVERFHAMFAPLLFEVLRLPAPDDVSPADGRDRESELRALLSSRWSNCWPSIMPDRGGGDRAAGASGGGNDHASARLSARRARVDEAIRRAC